MNAVCPAYVRTPLVEKQIADQAKLHGISEDAVVRDIMLAPAALKRLLEPSEVAAYVRFLCSDEASGITGATQVIANVSNHLDIRARLKLEFFFNQRQLRRDQIKDSPGRQLSFVQDCCLTCCLHSLSRQS